MRLIATLSALLVLLATCLTARAQQPASDATSFDAYVTTMLDEHWRLNPDWALAVGYYKYADRLAVPDAALRRAQRQFMQRQLRALAAFERRGLTPAQTLDAAMLRINFEAGLWQLDTLRDWQWQPSAYNVGGGFGTQLDTAYAPLDQRLRHVSQRLVKVPAYYAAAWRNIAAPTLEHTVLAIEQNQGGLSVLGDDLERQVATSGLSATEKAGLRRRITAARAAMVDYVHRLTGLKSRLEAGGARPFRIGPALYEQKFHHEIQSSFTAAQLHANAVAAKASLHAQMETLARELWPKYMGSRAMPDDRLLLIRQVIGALSLRHAKPEDFVESIRRQIPELTKFVADRDLVDQDVSRPLVVREMPAYQRGVAGANMQAPGPYDATALSYYNVSPLTDYSAEAAESFLEEYNDWMLQLLSIHEAVPGHYTQLQHANKSPSLVRSLFGNGAMVEGWAVYSERMMLDAGYGGGAPEMSLIWMKWNLRSVCNAILDYEVHAGSLDRAGVMRLLTAEAFQSDTEASEKWRRVTLTQVQLTSYYAGYAEIVALRDAERARLGAAFSVKAFNNRLLSYGSAPVRLIAERMRD